MVLAEVAGDGVACLVVSGQAALLVGDNVALLLGAHHDLDGGFLNLLLGDGLLALAGSQQGRLVDEVFQIRAGETGGGAGDRFQAHIGAEGLILRVDLEDLLAALDVGQAYIDLAVKTAWTQQRLIQDIRTVRGGHNDNAVVGIKTVHLDQQLVQGLLTLIVAAAETCAALTAYSIDLIDKDDGGHCLFGFFKQVTHAGGTNTDVHLDEVRAGNRVERHASLTGAGTSQQGLTGTRRADEQHAVRDARTQRVEFVGRFQELNDFLQLGLFLIGTGHIGKSCLALVLLLILDLGAAHIHDAAACSAAVHRHEQHTDAGNHSDIEDDFQPGNACLGGDIVEHHRGVGVGLVVFIDKIGDFSGVEVTAVGQFVGHIDRAAVGGQILVLRIAEAQQAAAGQAGCGVGLRQGGFAFLEPKFQAAGAKIQAERGHIWFSK